MSTLSMVLNIVVALVALALLVICTTAWLKATSRRTTLIADPSLPPMPRAAIGDWFGFVFAALSIIALAGACLNVDRDVPLLYQSAVIISFLSGLILAAGGVLFLVLANTARTLTVAQIERMDRQRAMAEGLRLAASLPEDKLRKRLYIALALHFCGVRASNSAVSQVVVTRSWRPLCGTPAVTRRLGPRRRRLLLRR